MEKRKPWPVVLNPLPLECFTSWLDRHQNIYGISSAQIIAGVTGHLPNPEEYRNYDVVVPPKVLLPLSLVTKLTLKRLRRLSIAYYFPHHARDRSTFEDFEKYVGSYSFLRQNAQPIPPVPANASPERPWLLKPRRDSQACPRCLERDQIAYDRLTWVFPLVHTCPFHCIDLMSYGVGVEIKSIWSAMDALTQKVMLQGMMVLADGQEITCGEWFRILRRLIYEVELAEPNLTDPHTFTPEFRKILKHCSIGPPMRSIVGNHFEAASLQRQMELLKMSAISWGQQHSNFCNSRLKTLGDLTPPVQPLLALESQQSSIRPASSNCGGPG